MPETATWITLPSGRVLQYQIFANSNISNTVATLFYFHGFPGAHPEGDMILRGTHNIRVVALSRPGFGRSTFQPRRTFMDWPKDVLECANQLGIRQFYILGFSGGAPFALACLGCLPAERLLRIAIVSGAHPGCLTSKDTLVMNRLLAFASTSRILYPLLPSIIDFIAGREACNAANTIKFDNDLVKEVGKRHPKEAEALENAAVRRGAIESCRESFRQGGRAMAYETKMLCVDWEIPINHLDASKLDIWYGGQDKNVSPIEALAAVNAWGGAIHLVDEESHVSLLVNCIDDILGQLLKMQA